MSADVSRPGGPAPYDTLPVTVCPRCDFRSVAPAAELRTLRNLAVRQAEAIDRVRALRVVEPPERWGYVEAVYFKSGYEDALRAMARALDGGS